jgi:FMN phosphatase YigB (HAD superfamily)
VPDVDVPMPRDATARCLLLDFSGVLFTDPMGAVQTAIANAAGMEREQVRRFYAETLRDRLWRGTSGEPEFWERLLPHAGLPRDARPWREMMIGGMAPLPAVAHLERWSEHATLFLLSNQRSEWIDAALARHDVPPGVFARRFVSDRTHRLKPEPAVFEAVIAAWDGPVDAMLYVDDDEGYLDAAARFGIATVHGDPAGRWRSAVEAWLER